MGYELGDCYCGGETTSSGHTHTVPDIGIKLTPSELIETARRIEELEKRVEVLEEASIQEWAPMGELD